MNTWIIRKIWRKNITRENFYSYLSFEDITNADYSHAKKVCKEILVKKISEAHDLYVQGNTSLLADVFEIFKKCDQKFMKLILLIFFPHHD